MTRYVIGRNSQVWKRLAAYPAVGSAGVQALGHRDVVGTTFSDEDVVWVLSYSRTPAENDALFAALRRAGARRLVYVSTATANVAALTRCYEYPRVKAAAEAAIKVSCPEAAVVRIGVVYEDAAELPGGVTAATSLQSLAAAICAKTPPPPGADSPLFSMVTRPFASPLARLAFTGYGVLMRLCGPWPCALRPLDVLLRLLGARWYGYLYMSNQLWLSTTSSSDLG